jgi:hypothetical protein
MYSIRFALLINNRNDSVNQTFHSMLLRIEEDAWLPALVLSTRVVLFTPQVEAVFGKEV